MATKPTVAADGLFNRAISVFRRPGPSVDRVVDLQSRAGIQLDAVDYDLRAIRSDFSALLGQAPPSPRGR